VTVPGDPPSGPARDPGASPVQKSTLDEPEVRAKVLAALRGGASLDSAAASVGLSRRALTKACIRDPDFGAAVQQARDAGRPVFEPVTPAIQPRPPRASVVRRDVKPSTPKPPPEPPAVPAIERECEAAVGHIPSKREFLAWCWETAKDAEHKSGPTCTKILAEVLVGPDVQAQRLRVAQQVEREADASKGDDGPVLVELPRNGTEAPGHEPRPASRALVIEVDAEARGLDS
jgi:hypothetical protein